MKGDRDRKREEMLGQIRGEGEMKRGGGAYSKVNSVLGFYINHNVGSSVRRECGFNLSSSSEKDEMVDFFRGGHE